MGVEIRAEATGDEDVFHLAGNLFARYREQAPLLADHLCPADRRIQHYLDELLAAAGAPAPVRAPNFRYPDRAEAVRNEDHPAANLIRAGVLYATALPRPGQCPTGA
ncbi:MAG: hypothetical protein ACREMX_03275 [Gemmatimonadales bacterium]